jgi:hypothetical protein
MIRRRGSDRSQRDPATQDQHVKNWWKFDVPADKWRKTSVNNSAINIGIWSKNKAEDQDSFVQNGLHKIPQL